MTEFSNRGFNDEPIDDPIVLPKDQQAVNRIVDELAEDIYDWYDILTDNYPYEVVDPPEDGEDNI